jgi:hypothetical protein
VTAASYTTKAVVKAEILTDLDDDTSWDDIIDRLIARASRMVDRYCGVQPGAFVQQAQTRTMDVLERGRVFLPERLQSVTSVKTDEDGDGTYEITWATTDYRLYPLDGPPYNEIRVNAQMGDYVFPIGQATLQIIGNWGEAGATAPDDIIEATILLVNRLFNRRKTPEGIAGSAEGGFLKMGTMDPDVYAILRDGGRLKRAWIA